MDALYTMRILEANHSTLQTQRLLSTVSFLLVMSKLILKDFHFLSENIGTPDRTTQVYYLRM